MKRFFTFMLSAMMICSVFVFNSSAIKWHDKWNNEDLLNVPIWSRETPPENPKPEQPGDPEVPEKPDPDQPGAEKPDQPKPEKPEGEKPVSPQTGYPIGIVGLSATAAACGAAAVIAGKKASRR